MKTYSPQVRPHAQGNLCCQHTFTEAARPRGEGDPVGGEREKIRGIIWCRGKNLLLDVLINKHCCLIPFHLLQPVHSTGTQPGCSWCFPSDLHLSSFYPLFSFFPIRSPHHLSLIISSVHHTIPLSRRSTVSFDSFSLPSLPSRRHLFIPLG